jgi:hypothetical protein
VPNEESAQPQKDPSDTEDGALPATESQLADIATLGGEDTSPNREITQAEAAALLDQLRHRTGREGD